MKIKTWKAWHDPKDCPAIAHDTKHYRLFPSPCRVIPEATWKRVMAVVKAAETIRQTSYPVTIKELGAFDEAVDALREHERKRK